jgi:hypothetical protein
MTLLSQNISKVRAFALPAGVKADGQARQLTGAAVVKWHSAYSDKLHQVYVNGRFAGATVDTEQRQIIVPIPLSARTAARIEVFVVEPKFADVDFSNQLAADNVQAGRVKIEFARTDNLPAGGSVDFYLSDYRLNNRSIKIRPDLADKGGFGLSSFGKSDFGFDGSAAVGFGKGNFGKGWFGFDADMFYWQSFQSDAGNYKFTVKTKDKAGNLAQEVETETMTVIPPAGPAEKLTAEFFDANSGKLILKVG